MDSLLDLKPPFDDFDRHLLEQWLGILEQDCEDFGEAQEDTERMRRIKDLLICDKLMRVW